MKIRKTLTTAFIFLVLAFSSMPFGALAQGGSISVTAEVDRATISTDEFLSLTLTVSGGFQELGEPTLPLIDGLTLVSSGRSSQFSMVNNVVTARSIFTYQIQPTSAGTFTINPISILVNGSPYQTKVITIQVTESTVPNQSQESGDSAAPSDPADDQHRSAPGTLTGQDLFVEADVDNPAPFVGQQIVYRFRFYRAVNLSNQPQLEWPPFHGFWSEGLNPNNVYRQVIGGREYRITKVRKALYPTIVGDTTIQPTTLMIPGGFFRSDTVLKSEPVTVNVKELPAGAPDGFLGAVGRFDISAWAEPVESHLNEPVTLVVRISGEGNLSTLPDPTDGKGPLLADWRVYDPKVTTNVSQDGDVIAGEKSFERLLVPKREGRLHIPSFGIVFFEPKAAKYQRVETVPLAIQIAPGETQSNGIVKQDVSILASDIRHIKRAPPHLRIGHTLWLGQPTYWLGWGVPALALAISWVLSRRRRFSDAAYAREQRVRRQVRRRLRQARNEARRGDAAAYATTAHAFADYLAVMLDRPTGSLTHGSIRQVLVTQEVPDELIDRLLICLDWADSGRFAPVAAGRDSTELVTDAEALIAELERAIKAR